MTLTPAVVADGHYDSLLVSPHGRALPLIRLDEEMDMTCD